MKKFSVSFLLMFVGLGLASGLVLAQEDPPFAPPTQALMPCPTEAAVDTEQRICDILATKPEDIAGVWAVYFNAKPAFIRYNMDGTWSIADTVEHTTAASTPGYPSGTFSFDENGVFTSTDPYTPADILPEECKSAQFILRVIKVDDQPVALNHAVLEDCFAPRRTDWAYTMLWVSGP